MSNYDFRIIYTDNDGNFCITVPAPEYVNKLLQNGMSLDDIKEHIAQKDVVQYSKDGTYHHKTVDDIPKDRYFRNAWQHDELGNISHNRAKAESIHMNNLRAMRDEKLKSLDVDYMKALENGDNAKSKDIAAKKQQLRDMPQNEDLSKFTIEELKDYIPEYLKD